VPGRYQAAAARTAAVLSLTAVPGLVLLGSFTDHALQQRLLDGQASLDAVRRIVRYTVPRPSVTTIGPLGLPTGAAALVSAVRLGLVLALVAATLSGGVWVLSGRQPAAAGGPRTGARWVPRIVVVALGILVLLVTVQAWRASWLSGRAAVALADGRPADARADLSAAIGANGTLRAVPAVQQLLGDTATATGTGSSAEQLHGQSVLMADAGHQDEALAFAVRAAAADPGQQAYTDQVCRLATARAAGAAGIDAVRSLVPVDQRCDLALLQLADTELTAGRYDLVAIDAGQLSRQTPDRDVRSAALTMQARAALAAGDLASGRALLRQALAADPEDLNVIARALATGLYSAGRG
jgi:hypothetical protein